MGEPVKTDSITTRVCVLLNTRAPTAIKSTTRVHPSRVKMAPTARRSEATFRISRVRVQLDSQGICVQPTSTIAKGFPVPLAGSAKTLSTTTLASALKALQVGFMGTSIVSWDFIMFVFRRLHSVCPQGFRSGFYSGLYCFLALYVFVGLYIFCGALYCFCGAIVNSILFLLGLYTVFAGLYIVFVKLYSVCPSVSMCGILSVL